MQKGNVFLKPNEAKFLALATVGTLELLEASARKENMPWTPEARRDLREMIEAARGLRVKLAKLGFDVSELPPYMEGDENEFFTKES